MIQFIELDSIYWSSKINITQAYQYYFILIQLMLQKIAVICLILLMNIWTAILVFTI